MKVTDILMTSNLMIVLPFLLLGLSLNVSAENLDEHLWRHRLIILIAPQATDAEVEQQLWILRKRSDALIDRDIRVYQLYQLGGSFYQDEPLSVDHAARLRARLKAKTDTKLLLLIGKDGTIKRRAPLNIDLRDIFRQIDGMPMRQIEIREKIEAGLPVTRP